MQLLKDAVIGGDPKDVHEVRAHFGNLYFGDALDPVPYQFTLKRFRNDGYGRGGSEGKPLYCLVPNQTVRSVWPEDAECYAVVRYGTGSKCGSCQIVCPAVCLQLPHGIGLYFCLTPEGQILEDADNFGV